MISRRNRFGGRRERNLKVAVKAAPVEKQAIVSAEATGVKTITLTMAKDVASVASPVAITVKKGAQERGCTPSVSGKTITLAMDAKLIAGDYTVTITGLEAEPLTAPVNVAKNETLTKYSISKELIAETLGVTTAAYFYYSALNQYDEPMVADKPNATCTLGKTMFTGRAGHNLADDVASATKEGKIYVTDIPEIFGIEGSTGMVTLVDPSGTGVTLTQEVTLSRKATPAKCEYVGVYHVNSAKIRDNIKENDKVNEFELLFKFEDQYQHQLSASDLSGVLTTSLAAGITEVKLGANSNYRDRTVDGVDYISLPLNTAVTAYAVAGDALLTITNNERGLLISEKVSVIKDTVIKSVTFTYDNGVYAGQENEIGYDIIDAEGNNVTDYATILNAVDQTKLATAGGNTNIKVKLERKADGSAKFILDATTAANPNSNNKSDQNSTPVTFTTYWNSTTGGDYKVVTEQCTMYQNRYAKTVMGIDPSTTLSFPVNLGTSKKISAKKIYLADQYGGKVVFGDKVNGQSIFTTALSNGSITAGNKPGNAAIAVHVVTNNAFEFDIVGEDMVITPSAVAGSGTVYMSLYTNGGNGNDIRTGQGKDYATVDTTHYDAKFTINIYDTKEIDNASLAVTVKDGWTVNSEEAITANLKDLLEVTANVGGSKTVLPAKQYTIIDNKNNSFTAEDLGVKDVKTKTATVTVRVTTYDKVGNTVTKDISADYTLSRDSKKVFAVDSAIDSADYTLTVSRTQSQPAIVTKSAFVTQFKYKSQYGGDADGATGVQTTGALITTANGEWGAGDLKFKADLVEGQKNECYVLNPGTTDIGIDYSEAEAGTYKYKITAYAKDGKEKTFTLTLVVNP